MPDLLQMHASTWPAKPAVIVDASGGAIPSTTTYAELDAWTNRLARGLLAGGARPGERIVWCGPNSLEVALVIHAARKAHLVAVPLSYRFNADEMAYVIDNSDATVVVVDAEYADRVASVRERIGRVRTLVGFRATQEASGLPAGFVDLDHLMARRSDDPPDSAIEAMDDGRVDASPESGPRPADDVTGRAAGAAMIYTSGTTGRPKGALRTRTDATLVFALVAELGLRLGEEVYITTGPLYHSGPLAFFSVGHSMGGTVVMLRRFDARAWLRCVREHRVTNTFSAPTQLKRIVSLPEADLAEADCSSMRCLIANAAPVPYALKQEVVAKLGDGFLYEVYGSTELGIVTVLHPEDQLAKPGSCGRTYGGIQVRIVREDGTDASSGEPGELFMSSQMAMDGYYKSAEQVAELDGGRWKSVGDVAYTDDEGYLYICDRKKDMIISGGVNIYPAEIEAALYGHPQVLDAAVFGIPDDEWGESVYCIVAPKAGEEIDLDELRAFTEGRVAGYMRPRAYEVRRELPRTDSGKLLKRVLRDEFWAAHDRAV